jgi:hypothetical protein
VTPKIKLTLGLAEVPPCEIHDMETYRKSRHENLKLCQLLNYLFQGKSLQYILDRKSVGLYNLVSVL